MIKKSPNTKFKNCILCSIKFFTNWKPRKFCSEICQHKFQKGKNAANWRGGNIKMICITCKKQFFVSKSQSKRWINCSMKCQGIWRSKKFVMEKSPRWNGGRVITKRGYAWIMVKNHPKANRDGYVSEHRYIMERKIGRYLKKSEVVHHINHNKKDNRIENLFLFKSQKEHLNHHAHVRRLSL